MSLIQGFINPKALSSKYIPTPTTNHHLLALLWSAHAIITFYVDYCNNALTGPACSAILSPTPLYSNPTFNPGIKVIF